MKDFRVLLARLLTTVAKVLGPGGTRTVVADSLPMPQLLLINRSAARLARAAWVVRLSSELRKNHGGPVVDQTAIDRIAALRNNLAGSFVLGQNRDFVLLGR